MKLRKNSKVSILIAGIITTNLFFYSSPVQAAKKTNSYTSLSQLPAGALVKDPNSSYDGSPIIWRVVDQGSSYPGCTTLMTKYALIPPRELNVGEPCFPDEDTRTYGYGQNDSTVLNRWLNSNQAVDWKDDNSSVGVYSYTYPNSPSYAAEKAFPLNFSQEFLSKVKETSVETLEYEETSYSKKLSSLKLRFFLPSLTEMAWSSVKEGKTMPYFYNYLHRQLVDTSGKPASYWLRTPGNILKCSAYVIMYNGSLAMTKVNNTTSECVAPMTNLDPSTSIASFDTNDRTYVLELSNHKVTGIKLNKSKLTIKKGKKYTLLADIMPANASNKNIIWKSSNKKTVKVDSNGNVTGVMPGKATITATTVDGNKTAKCTTIVSFNAEGRANTENEN